MTDTENQVNPYKSGQMDLVVGLDHAAAELGAPNSLVKFTGQR